MSSSSNVLLTLLVAATVPFLAAQSPATAPQGQSIPAPEAPKVPPPLPMGPAPDLDLVFSAQVAGYVEPCG